MKLFDLSGQTQQQADYDPALRGLVINEMRAAAPIFDFLEFYEMVGNSDAPKKGATATGGSSRALDNDYAGSTTTPDFGSVALKIYGDVIKTDLAHERRGLDITSERARQLASFAKSLGRHITDHVVNGDVADSATYFNGLKKQIAAAQTLTLQDGVNGAQVILGNSDAAVKSQEMFLHYLNKLIGKVAGGASFLVMNGDAISYLETIARNHVRTVNVDEALKGTVTMYKDVPIINAGYNKDESALVIKNNETVGASVDCTSIYAVKVGEKEDVTFATNVGVQVRDRGLVGVHYTTLVDFDIDMAILSANSAWRLKGIRLS